MDTNDTSDTTATPTTAATRVRGNWNHTPVVGRSRYERTKKQESTPALESRRNPRYTARITTERHVLEETMEPYETTPVEERTSNRCTRYRKSCETTSMEGRNKTMGHGTVRCRLPPRTKQTCTPQPRRSWWMQTDVLHHERGLRERNTLPETMEIKNANVRCCHRLARKRRGRPSMSLEHKIAQDLGKGCVLSPAHRVNVVRKTRMSEPGGESQEMCMPQRAVESTQEVMVSSRVNIAVA